MSWPYLGRFAAVGIGVESTWGTAVARTVWFRLVSESMKRSVKKERRGHLYEATGSGNIKNHFISSDEAGGSFEILCGYEGLGLLLNHALWKTPTTVDNMDGTYTHTYKLNATPPTGGLTIEIIRGTGTAEVFEGCRISKITLKIEAAGLMRVTCDVIAETSGGRVSAGSPTFTANDPLDVIHHQAGTVAWNSLTLTPKSVEFTLDHKLARRQLLGSKLTKDPAPSDFAEVMLKLDHEWAADGLNAGLTADTESDLTMSFTGVAGRIFGIAFHNAYLDDVSDPVSAVGVISQSATFRAQSDGTDEGLALTITNTQSTAVAA